MAYYGLTQQPQAAYVAVRQHDNTMDMSPHPYQSQAQAVQKPEPEVHLDSVELDANGNNASEAEAKSDWGKNHRKDKNPTKRIYDSMYQVGQGRWVMAIVVLGLSAAIVAKKPKGWTLAGGAVNITCASMNFFIFGPFAAPRSTTDPRPPGRFYLKLTIITIAWLVALGAILLAFRYSPDDGTMKGTGKRRRGVGRLGGVGPEAAKQGIGMYSALENIILGCAGVVLTIIIACLSQWFYVWKLSRRVKRATEEEVSDARRRLMNEKAEDEGDVEAQAQ